MDQVAFAYDLDLQMGPGWRKSVYAAELQAILWTQLQAILWTLLVD